MYPRLKCNIHIPIRLHSSRTRRRQINRWNNRARFHAQVESLISPSNKHVNLSLRKEASRTISRSTTKGRISLSFMQVLLPEETLRVENERIGAEDIAVEKELAEGGDDFLSFGNLFAADNGVDHGFAGDGGAVVDAEDFVPDGVELGAFVEEAVHI
jgi:hypothetical protein